MVFGGAGLYDDVLFCPFFVCMGSFRWLRCWLRMWLLTASCRLTQRSYSMSHSGTALVVIDVQESFRHRPYWSDADASVFFDCLQALIDGSKAKGIAVAQIFHVRDIGAFSLESTH